MPASLRLSLPFPPPARASWLRGLLLLATLVPPGAAAGDRAASTRVVPGLELPLVAIPAGTFVMGSPASEAGRYRDEGPQVRVTITRPFWLGRTAVTVGQWKKLMGTDLGAQAEKMVSKDMLYEIGTDRVWLRGNYLASGGRDPAAMVWSTEDNTPMYCLSWEDAAAFCRRLNAQERAANRLPEGYEYRLPTEAEWEYACRAGTTTATYAGDLAIKGRRHAPALDAIAWYAGNSSVGYQGRGWATENWTERQFPGPKSGPRAVGSKQPNAWGLCDMIGNVYQWCGDWYASGLVGGADPQGPAKGTARVIRGGSWDAVADRCRAAWRSGRDPGPTDFVGFRLALAPQLPPPVTGETTSSRQVADLALTLVPIPAGTFTMGSPPSEESRFPDEGPQTQVTITRPFWLGEFPVTIGQWTKLMGIDMTEQVRRMLADDTRYDIGGRGLTTIRAYLRKEKDSDPASLLLKTDPDLPMYFVSWDDAAAFCRKLNEIEAAAHRLPDGYEYRLPTEAEWEYACRAGTTTASYAGDVEILGRRNAPALDAIAWYSGNSSLGYSGPGVNTAEWPEKQYPGGYAGPRAVGTKLPNAWGLYDMLGNMNQWCWDWFQDALPSGEDPHRPESIVRPGAGPYKPLRGGSWRDSAGATRAASRDGSYRGWRSTACGFRVALAPRMIP